MPAHPDLATAKDEGQQLEAYLVGGEGQQRATGGCSRPFLKSAILK